MGCVSDIHKDGAADEFPDGMRDFGSQEVHEIASVIILVPVFGTDGAVGESADGVTAAEEVAFIDRGIFLPVADHADHADFCADRPDEHLIEERVVIDSFEFHPVIIFASDETEVSRLTM